MFSHQVAPHNKFSDHLRQYRHRNFTVQLLGCRLFLSLDAAFRTPVTSKLVTFLMTQSSSKDQPGESVRPDRGSVSRLPRIAACADRSTAGKSELVSVARGASLSVRALGIFLCGPRIEGWRAAVQPHCGSERYLGEGREKVSRKKPAIS